MNIQEYITQTLRQINEGVDNANTKEGVRIFKLKKHEPIKFDLAVINKSTGKGKVSATVLGLGGKADGSMSKDQVSRISFQVEHRANLSRSRD